MRAAQSAFSGRPPQGGGEQNPGRQCGERKPEAGGAGEKPQGGEPRTGEGGATRVTSPGKDGGGFAERAGAGSGAVRRTGVLFWRMGDWRARTPRRGSEVAGGAVGQALGEHLGLGDAAHSVGSWPSQEDTHSKEQEGPPWTGLGWDPPPSELGQCWQLRQGDQRGAHLADLRGHRSALSICGPSGTDSQKGDPWTGQA